MQFLCDSQLLDKTDFAIHIWSSKMNNMWINKKKRNLSHAIFINELICNL